MPSDKDYRIGPEDVLDIQVWGSKELNQTVFVRPDGQVSVPLIGEVAVAGKTVQQLQDHLSTVYKQMVKGALVTVVVKEINSRPVYFIGGFAKPGPMQLTRDLTLLQAIAVVGGVAPNADGEKGFLVRGNDKIPIDISRLVQRGDLSQNPKLKPGDSVVVPLADVVYVSGEVRRPGVVKYTGDLTVLTAITQAGGLTPWPPRARRISSGGAQKRRSRSASISAGSCSRRTRIPMSGCSRTTSFRFRGASSACLHRPEGCTEHPRQHRERNQHQEADPGDAEKRKALAHISRMH